MGANRGIWSANQTFDCIVNRHPRYCRNICIVIVRGDILDHASKEPSIDNTEQLYEDHPAGAGVVRTQLDIRSCLDSFGAWRAVHDILSRPVDCVNSKLRDASGSNR